MDVNKSGLASLIQQAVNMNKNMRAISVAMALVFGLASASAFACPKGTHPVGGTGSHHKGGKCVSASSAKAAEAVPDSKADSKANDKAAKKNAKGKAKKKAEATK